MRSVLTGERLDLNYFVEWRPALWAPAVRWLVSDPTRFEGRRVLELGCRNGRMSCLFALLGAQVTGMELPSYSLDNARQEAQRWGIFERIKFTQYSGAPQAIPAGPFDFVFTKSVLVVVPELQAYMEALSQRVGPSGELLLAENLSGSWLIKFIRRSVIRQHWGKNKRIHQRFHGVNQEFLEIVRHFFCNISMRSYWGVVAAIRARKD